MNVAWKIMDPGHRRPRGRLLFRAGFSLVELLVVIAVIAILLGILFVGVTRLMSSSKEKATHSTMGSLKSMLAELDAKTKLGKPPAHWRWWNGGTIDVTTATAPGLDFWRTPFVVGGIADAMDAPGQLDADSGERARNGSRQVLNTQLVMTLMLGLPDNKAVFGKIPADRYYVPVWNDQWGTYKVPAPEADGVAKSGGAPTAQEDIYYPQGASVQVLKHDGTGALISKNLFVCVAASTLGSTEPVPPTIWAPSANPVPLLLDAWDNPIIFVPASGLRVHKLNGASVYVNSDGTIPTEVRTEIIMSPEGQADNLSAIPKVVKVGRPFFASAGEDGDFSRGDDNIYSFEE